MQIPEAYVTVCRDWHDGQSSMMYAIASTGRLSPGSNRPFGEDGFPVSGREWYRQLWAGLASEIRGVQRMGMHSVRRARQLRGFLRLAERMEKRLS